MTDKGVFAAAMNTLAGAFRTPLDEATLEGYWIGLEELTPEQLWGAVKQAIKTSKFMPSVSEIREAAGIMTDEAKALNAWGRVVETIRKFGHSSGRLEFDDPAIHGAIRRLGGWVRLCDTGSDELHSFSRKAFLEAYGACVQFPDEVKTPLSFTMATFGEEDRVRYITTRPVDPKAPKALPPVPRNGKSAQTIGDLVASLAPKGHQ